MTADDRFREIIRDVVLEVLAEQRDTKPSNGDEYLTTAAAARLADCSVPTIRRWIRKKHLRKYMAGARVRVRRAELERYLTGSPAQMSPADRARRKFG